jgi:hypothetical protein
MAADKSEKEAMLSYIIQPFARHFVDGISSVQLLAANESHLFNF